VDAIAFGDLSRRRAEVVGMDVKAVIIVGGNEGESERIAGVPIALLDVLGQSVLDRVIDRLESQGVCGVSVVGELSDRAAGTRRANVAFVHTGESPWRAAENAFGELAQAGADIVLVLRLGPYVEFDVEHLIQFHLDQTARVTAVVDRGGTLLDQFAISASRRNDAAFLLRSELRQFRSGCVKHEFSGYCNRLTSAAGLRQLAIDAFCGANQVVPVGREIRPGVWVADDARIQRGARLLAPCFIGAHAKVRAHAVVTRCSTIEHDACVDFGTVVENSSILPYTNVGAGLDVIHSVVGFRKVSHLARAVAVEITDPKLIDAASNTAPVRALGQAVSLAAFLPRQLVRGIVNGRRRTPATLPQAVRAPSSALKEPTASPENSSGEEFQAPFIVARR
jgi:hypothetical protein